MQRKQRLYATALEAIASEFGNSARASPSVASVAQPTRELADSAFGLAVVHLSRAKVVREDDCVQKLLQEFASDPAKMLREKRACGFTMATFEQLCEARDQTKRMAERGLLRPLRRSMWGDRKIIWSPLRIRQRFRCGRHLDIR